MRLKLLLALLVGSVLLLYGLENTSLRARSQSDGSLSKRGEYKFYPSAYHDDEQLVEQLIQRRELEQLFNLATTLETKYHKEMEPFSQLLSRISSALSSYDFGDNRQFLYSEEIARKVLTRSDEIPVETEFAMVRQLRSDLKYIHKLTPVSDWPADRAQRIAYLIRLDRRINNQIDRSFDLKARINRPVANVCPGNGYVCGIRPDDIKEPNLRARYREAIDSNILKAKKYNLQYKLHELDKEMPQFVDRFLVSLYSRPPFDRADLDRSLNALGIAGPRGDRIIAMVLRAFREPDVG